MKIQNPQEYNGPNAKIQKLESRIQKNEILKTKPKTGTRKAPIQQHESHRSAGYETPPCIVYAYTRRVTAPFGPVRPTSSLLLRLYGCTYPIKASSSEACLNRARSSSFPLGSITSSSSSDPAPSHPPPSPPRSPLPRPHPPLPPTAWLPFERFFCFPDLEGFALGGGFFPRELPSPPESNGAGAAEILLEAESATDLQKSVNQSDRSMIFP